jgi:Flp pilus assembly pilin Flp
MWTYVKVADARSMSLPGRNDRMRSCGREEGQTMAEYAVVLAVITPVVVLAFATFGNAIIPVIDTVRSFL